jgi:hypothetical protein
MRVDFLRRAAACGIAAGAALLYGCKAAPAEPTGFAPNHEQMKKYELVPLDRAWVKSDIPEGKYRKIMVEPVFTKDALKNRSWMERNNLRAWIDAEDQDVAEFAKYTEEAFKNAIKNSKKIQLADKPGPDTLLLELSLVKVVQGKPVVGALSNMGSLTPIGFMLVPLKVANKAASDSPMQSSIAIEGVLRDSETKEVVAAFMDREKESAAVFNVNDFTSYGNLKNIVNMWARIFVECIEKRPLKTGTKIETDRSLRLLDF